MNNPGPKKASCGFCNQKDDGGRGHETPEWLRQLSHEKRRELPNALGRYFREKDALVKASKGGLVFETVQASKGDSGREFMRLYVLSKEGYTKLQHRPDDEALCDELIDLLRKAEARFITMDSER